MPHDRKEPNPFDDRQRPLLRLRGRRRRTSEGRPRRAAAILSMVDLLSCAFGGALFLFMLTAQPAQQATAAPKAPTDVGFLKIEAKTNSVRPVFYFQDTNDPKESFRVDRTRIKGNSSLRVVKMPPSNPNRGKVWTYGPTPWDTPSNAKIRLLYLRLQAPQGKWCLRVGMQNDDTNGRAGPQPQITKLTISQLLPGSTQMKVIKIRKWTPLGMNGTLNTISSCIPINWGAS